MFDILLKFIDIIINNIYIYIYIFFLTLAQYAEKNGLHQKKAMLAIPGIFAVVMFLLVEISIVYWLVMSKKKKVNKSLLSLLYKVASFSSISLLLRLVNKIPKGNSNNIFGNWEFCFIWFCVFLRMGVLKRMGWNMV